MARTRARGHAHRLAAVRGEAPYPRVTTATTTRPSTAATPKKRAAPGPRKTRASTRSTRISGKSSLLMPPLQARAHSVSPRPTARSRGSAKGPSAARAPGTAISARAMTAAAASAASSAAWAGAGEASET